MVDERAASSNAGVHLRSTAKHGGIYALGTVLARMASFLMLPIYTRVLSAEEYGVLEILGLSADVLSMVAGLGIGNAVLRIYYASKDEDEKRLVHSTAWVLLALLFGFVGLIGWISAGTVSALLLGSQSSFELVRLALIGLLLNVLGDVPLIRLRALQQSTAVVGASLARLLVTLALNVLFVVWMRMGVRGVLISNIVASFVVGGFVTVQSFRETGWRFRRATAASLLRFGAPLMIAQLAGFVLHFSDRYFLLAYSSLAAVGLYSLAYKLAMLLPVFVFGPFKSIWDSKALQIASAEGEGAIDILSGILRYYNLVLVSAGFLVALYAHIVVDLVAGPAFRDASGPVPILVLAMIFFGYRSVAQVGALIAMSPRYIAVSSTVAAVVLTLLNVILIPRYGMYGAAVATFGGFGVEFLVMRLASARVYPFLYPLRSLFGPIAVAALVWIGVNSVAGSLGLVAGLMASSLGIPLYVGLLTGLGMLSSREIEWLVSAVRSPRTAMRAFREA